MSEQRTDPDVVLRVLRVAQPILMVEDLDPATDLVDTSLLDSLSLVELLFALEQEFGVVVSFDDLDVESFRTVERIADWITSDRAA